MPYLLTENISYLLAQTCKAHRGLADKWLSEVGLHVGQEMILCRLQQHNGLTQSELAEQLCVQAATVTKMLQRMEQASLIERRGDAQDQRLSRVYLTQQGHSLHQPISETWTRLEETVTQNLSLEEKLLLRRLLMQVYTNLSQQL
jgi:DNA-binding MarR family transcriptional regulator